MIAALVLFDNVHGLDAEAAREKFESTAPNYRGRHGLISKAYIYRDDGETLGGFYLWESRDAAEAVYSEGWRQKVSEVYGTEPRLEYFEVPVYIQNVSVESTLAG